MPLTQRLTLRHKRVYAMVDAQVSQAVRPVSLTNGRGEVYTCLELGLDTQEVLLL